MPGEMDGNKKELEARETKEQRQLAFGTIELPASLASYFPLLTRVACVCKNGEAGMRESCPPPLTPGSSCSTDSISGTRLSSCKLACCNLRSKPAGKDTIKQQGHAPADHAP
eukprot:1138504-Pelagomonas_calceolata.AAC.8